MNAPSLAPAAPACCEDETWKPVPDWPHEASTCGRVRRLPWRDGNGCLHLGGEIARCPDKRKGKGYLYATLRDGQRQRRAHVAVLVLEAHRRRRPGPGWEASHLRGIRTDNHLSGLDWETRPQNLARIAQHAAEKTVTARAPETPDTSQEGRFPRMARDARARHSRYAVTGRKAREVPLPFHASSSHFTLVQPRSSSLRDLFRSRRDQGAA